MDHPEMIPRAFAFQALLDLLSITPEDAPYRQSRARLIETRRIGLGTEDAAQLENIVETYRVQEEQLKSKNAAMKVDPTTSHQDFVAQKKRHFALLREASASIKLRISSEGRAALSAFIDEIISKSTVSKASASIANGGQR